MGKEYVMKCIADIEVLAKEEGLDFFPTIFETVDRDIMLEACSYGLPVRARHWSYGRSYQHQKIYGEMGLSKIYEIDADFDPEQYLDKRIQESMEDKIEKGTSKAS